MYSYQTFDIRQLSVSKKSLLRKNLLFQRRLKYNYQTFDRQLSVSKKSLLRSRVTLILYYFLSNLLKLPQISSQILHFLPARPAGWNNQSHPAQKNICSSNVAWIKIVKPLRQLSDIAVEWFKDFPLCGNLFVNSHNSKENLLFQRRQLSDIAMQQNDLKIFRW